MSITQIAFDDLQIRHNYISDSNKNETLRDSITEYLESIDLMKHVLNWIVIDDIGEGLDEEAEMKMDALCEQMKGRNGNLLKDNLAMTKFVVDDYAGELQAWHQEKPPARICYNGI